MRASKPRVRGKYIVATVKVNERAYGLLITQCDNSLVVQAKKQETRRDERIEQAQLDTFPNFVL